MSTTKETEKFRTLLYAKWNEIFTKYRTCVLRDTCHGTVTGFNVKHLYNLATTTSCDSDRIFLKRKSSYSLQYCHISRYDPLARSTSFPGSLSSASTREAKKKDSGNEVGARSVRGYYCSQTSTTIPACEQGYIAARAI